jgi:hypothetical protein
MLVRLLLGKFPGLHQRILRHVPQSISQRNPPALLGIAISEGA